MTGSGGTLLVSVGPDLWTVDETVDFYGLKLPHTMAVMRLADGGVILHSPIRPTEALCDELRSLGDVRFVVAPTYYHDLYLDDCAAAFPGATVHVTPALKRLAPPHVLLERDGEGNFGPDVAYLRLAGLRVGEYAFLHRPSRTLILADVLFNLGPDGLPPLTRVAMWLDGAYGHPAVPLSIRLLAIADRARLKAAMERILAWDFERLIVGHGSAVDRDARAVVAQAFRWLR